MKKPSKIALVDCNNFYASCEKVFNPKLRDKPIVVLSNNDGIIISRSSEAKALGIKMGDPYFKVEKFIKQNNVVVFSSNYTLYGDLSQRVMTTLEKFSPDVEIYSIDEAFLNLDGIESQNQTEYLHKIKNTIFKWIGLPVSVGMGPTKTLAKIATHYAKQHNEFNGILNLFDYEDYSKFLKETEVEDIWGVGRQYSALLHLNGMHTAWDFTLADEKWVKKKMTIVGLRTLRELKGESCIEIEQTPPAKKSIISSRTFGEYLTNLSDMREAVAFFTARASEKMRSQNSAAKMLGVFIRTNPFKNSPQYYNSVQISLPHPIAAANELMYYAERGLEKIYRDGYYYQKVGVLLADFVPISKVQVSLFDPPNRFEQLIATEVMDKINKKYGSETLHYASMGISDQRTWRMKRSHLSGNYTTAWEHLPIVKAK